MCNLIYLRTSTNEQNPEIQLRDIQSAFNLDDYKIFIEKDSAWAENVVRPEFDNCLSLIKSGKVNHVYVWHLDRIYRNRKKLKDFFLLCNHKKTTIHSFSQKWLESINSIPEPFNEIVQELLVNLMGWTAEDESTKKSNRIKMAVVKKENSKTVSYKGNRWGRKPFPPQTIKRVLELSNQGLSIRQIASQVTVFDKNRNEKKISRSSVHKILGLKSCK